MTLQPSECYHPYTFPELNLELLEALLDRINRIFPCRLVFGMLYPAYYSYKAVKTKNVKEYVSKVSVILIWCEHRPWETLPL